MNMQHSDFSGSDRCLALLVDRDRASLQMYAEYLRNASYDVEEAEDGREALAKAISRRPQIIVTETQLPGINGLRLCELLRVDKATQSTPIIVVTADALPADILRAECAGADAVLTKPCRPERLAAEMQRCLTTSAAVNTRAAAARLHATDVLARSAEQLEKARRIRRRVPLSRMFRRHTTTTPPQEPPQLVCPTCDAQLVYQDSHIGGVSDKQQEQWDYYECPGKCGRFQYRQRTRKIRRLI
jgi:two-component system, cell cycle response regulator DivK